MQFKYSCFISHCSAQGDLMKRFVQELREALEASLEPLLLEKVFIDENRLKPGFLYNEALASAICHSVSMVVVYSPTYERHPYCLREYRAMELLQERRKKVLESTLGAGVGLIIPVLLRGRSEDLPARIRGHIHYCDFSKYALASPQIRRKREYVEKIDSIAEFIYDLYNAFQQAGQNLCADCGAFALPKESEVESWNARAAQLPLREGGALQ